MLVVIEGPDGVGKTSVCELLTSGLYLLNGKTFKKINSFPRYKNLEMYEGYEKKLLSSIEDILKNDIDNKKQLELQIKCTIDKFLMMDILEEYKNDKNIYYVLDRYKTSSLVYGSIGLQMQYQKQSEISIKHIKEILYTLNSCLLDPDFDILLIAPFNKCFRRMLNRNSYKSIYEQQHLYEKIYDEYIQLYSDPFNFNFYNKDVKTGIAYNDRTLEDSVYDIIHILKESVE